MIGIVQFYDIHKNFGFLEMDDGETIFVHQSALAPCLGGYLVPSDRVQFRMGQDRKTKRPCAIDVRPCLTTGDLIKSMKSLRGALDGDLTGMPGANESLADIRFALDELEQIAATLP